MTSSLAETIESDFLSCSICLESYNDPRVLPCQHRFCLQCLERCVVSSIVKHTLVCPTCREVVKLSEQGVQDLPVHFLVRSLNDAVKMDNMEKTPNCCICDDSNHKATVRCLDCEQYLCDSCNTSHKSFKALRNHRVIAIEYNQLIKADFQAEEKTFCTNHQAPHRYYCQNEKKTICQDCVILKKCPHEHDRITIDEAVQERSKELEDLVKTSDEILKKYQDSVKEVDIIEKELKIHSELAKAALVVVEQEYIKLVKETVKRFEDEIDNTKEERMKQLNREKTNLESTMKEIEKVNEDVKRVIKSAYKMEVLSIHTNLSTKLETLSNVQLFKVDKTLGYVKFEATIPSTPNIGQLLKEETSGKTWKLIGQFTTGDFNQLNGLAIDQDGNILVCSREKGVKVFTRNGDAKSTLYNSSGSVSVGVLPGKKYVTAPCGASQIIFINIFDSWERQVVTCHITNVNKVPSGINSLSVDSANNIIVGQYENTISIHNTDGSLISKFATQYKPYRLAATSCGDIVSSIWDVELGQGTSVQIMDYVGKTIRVIQPPDEVKVWSPGFVCSGQGEIFVTNEGAGDPHGVYRFTSEGDYLGCVTTQVGNPSGIALSRDGMELFVADSNNHVKIFERT